MFWLLGFLSVPAIAEPVLAVDYVPFSRADLVWIGEDWTSGTGVGEFDGLLKSPLTPWVGIRKEAWTGLATVGAARIATITNSDTERQLYARSGLRVGLAAQRELGEWNTARPWLGVGASVTIPFARDQADSYSNVESAEAEINDSADRARIGGLGARAGGGVDLPILTGAHLGIHTHLVTHAAASFTETSTQYSLLTWMETALRLEVALR